MAGGTYRPMEKPIRVRDRRAMATLERRWCGWCGRYDRPVHYHHIKSRGAGGGEQKGNGIGLCDLCHDAHHRGKSPTKEQLHGKMAEII
jgi:hypothetical protein